MKARPSAIRSAALDAARRFDPLRARRTLDGLWGNVRTMDTPSVQRGAELLANALRDAGIANVRVQSFPSDGRASAAGWLAPVAWQVSEARLEVVGEPASPLADFAKAPQSIALFSPPTSGDDWVEGCVMLPPAGADKLTLEALAPILPQLRGKFLFLPPGAASLPLNSLAAEHGVLAVLATSPGPIPDVSRYLNYAVPLAADAPCVPTFALTPDTAAKLRERLASCPDLRLRARVRAARSEGTMPVVTGSVGTGGGLPILLCGHMDEPGANDNASGPAVGVEALRILQELCANKDGLPQVRQIRFIFSTELRGPLFWLNAQPRRAAHLLSLNLDMVGADPTREPCAFRIGAGYPHRPNFGRRVLDSALELADQVVKNPCARKPGNCVLGDSAMVGIHDGEGAVSIEQGTGPSYHTNADTPERLISNQSLHWSGAATAAFLYLASRADNGELATLAATVRDEALRTLAADTPEAAVAARKLAVELETIERAVVPPNLYNGWNTAAAYYAAGVNRRTGRWPGVAAAEKLRATAREVTQALAARPAPPLAVEAAWRQEADRLVPQALFRGPLCFEDQWQPEARRKLMATLGLEPGWGTDNWAWRLATFFRGRQTLTEILEETAAIGFRVDPAQALKLTRLLVELGKVQLRPVIDAGTLRDALVRAGVRRGSILMVHSGLSRYGYVPGGAVTVVNVLRDLLGPEGTLVMPTHSNSVLGAAPFNPQTSRSNVGAITEYFRKLPGARRSFHPTHSVAALGPAAEALTADPMPLSPLDRRGFWGRLYDREGDVLLLCPIRSATALHVGEAWVNLPQGSILAHVETPDGKRRTVEIPNAPWHVDHFEATMAAPLLASGAMRQVQLGDAPIFFATARAMIDISVQVNREKPLVSLGKDGQCSCFYCTALRAGMARSCCRAPAPAPYRAS
jgi:aminoglycoside 3-N-acetyltransferase